MKTKTTTTPPLGAGLSKIYIAGKISGLPMKEVTAKFAQAQKDLEGVGYTVVNPVELVRNYLHSHYPNQTLSDEAIWRIAMRVCIKELVDCEAVCLLPDWQESRGATIEQQLALDLRIPYFHYIQKEYA